MKKFYTWFSKKKMFAKTFFSICAIAFAAILVVNSIVFLWFRKKSAEDYRELASMSVLNTDIVFSQYIQSGIGLVKNWYHTAEGQDCRMDGLRQTAKHMGFINDMRQMVSAMPYVQSVNILNYRGEEMLSFGMGLSYTQELDKILFEKLQQKAIPQVCFAWNVANRYEDQPDVPLITVYFQEADPGDDHYWGTVAMHLDARMLGKSIFSTSDQGNFQIFILNKDGMVAAGSISSCFGEDWSKKDFMKNILDGQQGPFYETEEDGSVSEFTAVPSAIEGYYVVARARKGENTGKAGHILNVLLISGILASAFIMITTLLVCTRLYRPFYGMLSDFQESAGRDGKEWDMDEVQFLHNFYNELTGHISELNDKSEKEAVIKALLTGNQDSAVRDYLLEKEIVQNGEGFYIVLLCIYRKDAYQDANMGEYDELRKMAGTIYSAKLGELGSCSSFELGLRRILLLLTEENGHTVSEDALRLCLNQAQKMVSEIKGAESYAVVSEKMEKAEEFCARQYRKMEDRLLLGQFLQKEEHLFCTDLQEEEFPQEILSHMVESVKAREQAKYQEAVEKFLECCSKGSYSVFLTWNAEASWELIQIGRTLHGNQKENKAEKDEIYRKITQQKNRKELLWWYMGIYRDLVSELGRTDSQSLDALMEKAVDYIREHYDNVDLNVNMLADVLGISAAYFGKLFKEFAGCSMVEYLKKVRMEKAYEMLVSDSAKSVSQVAKEAGFGNPAYFTTLFKKQYGVSPSKLRDANRMGGVTVVKYRQKKKQIYKESNRPWLPVAFYLPEKRGFDLKLLIFEKFKRISNN